MNPKNFAGCACTSLVVTLTSSFANAQDADDPHHEIDEVVVTATPLARTVEQLSQPATVIFGEELAKKSSTSIGETVSRELGVSSSYFGPTSSRPVIRGQYGERVRVLSNGLDALDASALSEDHQTTVDSLLAQSVEIIRGPATILYGSGASGGLVNVVDSRIVRKQLEEPVSGTVAVGADTGVDRREAAAQIKIGAGPFAFSADYLLRDTGNVQIPGFAESELLRSLEEEEEHEEEEGHAEEEEAFGEIENTDSETQTGALSASLVSSNGYTGLTYSVFDSQYGIPGHGHHHEEGEEEEEEEEETVRIDLEQQRFDLQGEYEFDSLLSGIRFRGAYNDYKHVELEGAEIGTVFESKGADGRVELLHGLVGGFEGAIGLQYRRVDFDAVGEEAFVPPSETTNTSIFLFEEIGLGDAWVLQASGRVEQQDISTPASTTQYDDTAWGASLGLIWRPTDNSRVALNGAFSQRHPSATELFADGPHIAAQRVERGSVTIGAGLLKQEESSNVDLTWHGDVGALEFSLTGFINDIDNYIVLRPTDEEEDELQVWEYRQTDARISGVEASIKIEVLDSDVHDMHVRVWTDFIEGKERGTDAFLPRMTPQRMGVGAHYTRGGWETGLEALIVSRQTDVADNELPTDGYVSLDFDLSYQFDNPNILLFLRGINLTDEEQRQHTSPLKDIASLPGRSLHAGVRYGF